MTMTSRELADRFGITPMAMDSWLKTHGIDPVGTTRVGPTRQWARLYSLERVQETRSAPRENPGFSDPPTPETVAQLDEVLEHVMAVPS